MDRRRLVQTGLLVAGLVGIAFAVPATLDQAQEQVLPSLPTIVFGGVCALVAIAASARAWSALFSDLLTSRAHLLTLRGTFYLSQLTKYLPVGGLVQASSQLGLAHTVGIPVKRIAVAFPVSVVAAVSAGATLSSGLVFDSALPGWVRALSVFGLAVPLFLHRGLMARVLHLARRVSHRIPEPDHLPTQRDIIIFYLWALVTVGALCAAYAAMLRSLTDMNPFSVFCAFALSWLAGFLAVPIPAGVGVREAVLVALLPGVGTAPVLAVSLTLRLLSIGAELLTTLLNKIITRRAAAGTPPATPATATVEAPPPR
jgi:hypothetical protein